MSTGLQDPEPVGSQWIGLPEESACKHSLARSPSPVPPRIENMLLGSTGSAGQRALDTLSCSSLTSFPWPLPTPWITRSHPLPKEATMVPVLCNYCSVPSHADLVTNVLLPSSQAHTAIAQEETRLRNVKRFSTHKTCHRPDPLESALLYWKAREA